MMRAWILATALCAPIAAQAECRQALALGLDVSGSVDAREYRLQLDGLAQALGDPEVSAALLSQPSAPVRIAIYEWSAPKDDRLIIDWKEVNAPSDIAQIQAALLRTQRAQMGPSTGLGAALHTGFSLLEHQSECWTQTLDISGDGKGNTGQRPQDIADPVRAVTVNGLVIGDAATDSTQSLQIGELAAYYSAYVIRGHGAFVETALGFDSYADAMRRKLLRELNTFAIGQIPTAAHSLQ